MIQEVLQAFFLIFMAEMGDKTQILAMAFATKYPVKKVLLGIMIGSFVNHGIAVALGSQLTRVMPIERLQIIAGLAFLIFAFWSLKPEEAEEEKEKEVKYGAIITVALAFFIGELGDKTQLTAITIASSATSPALVLLGTVSGMVATGSLGIIVGKKLGDKVPEFLIKALAAMVFLAFATGKLYKAIPQEYLSLRNMLIYTVLILMPFTVLISVRFKSYRLGVKTTYEIKSKALYDYYNFLDLELSHLCLGKGNCGQCEGNRCPVGMCKEILHNVQEETSHVTFDSNDLGDAYKEKSFDATITQHIIEETERISALTKENKEDLEQVLSNMKKIQK